MRTTKSVTISLPPAQLRTAERLAKLQSRTMSELFREGLRRLEQEEKARPVALQDLAATVRLIQQEAKRVGLDKITMHEIDAEVEAVRKKTRAKPKGPANRSRK